MKTLNTSIFFIFLFLFPSISNGIDYKFKKIEEFKVLESFKTIEDFEKYYEKYTQECLDNTYGGTGGIPCFIGYEIWDRELNIYYKKLYTKLDNHGKKLLKDSQLAWVKERDLSIKLNSFLLDKVYTEPGTMFLLMRAGDADSMITPIIKQRTLVLKTWLQSI